MNIYKMLMAIMRVIRLSRRIMRVSYRVRHQSSHKRFRHKTEQYGDLPYWLFSWLLVHVTIISLPTMQSM